MVEHLAKKGVRLSLEDWRDSPNPATCGWSVLLMLPDGHDLGSVIGATVPLAICRAALLAKQEGT